MVDASIWSLARPYVNDYHSEDKAIWAVVQERLRAEPDSGTIGGVFSTADFFR
jgi:hypothetical protein